MSDASCIAGLVAAAVLTSIAGWRERRFPAHVFTVIVLGYLTAPPLLAAVGVAADGLGADVPFVAAPSPGDRRYFMVLGAVCLAWTTVESLFRLVGIVARRRGEVHGRGRLRQQRFAGYSPRRGGGTNHVSREGRGDDASVDVGRCGGGRSGGRGRE
jgi:hypothetical protein